MPLQLTVLVIISMLRFHSIHISYGKAEVTDRTVHIKVSYYKDDYMKAVDQWYGNKLSTFTAQQVNDAQIGYFKNFFRLWSGEKFTHPLAIVNYQLNDDATSVIFEATFTSDIPISLLTVDHRSMLKEYNDQSNILSLHGFGKEYNVISTASKPTTIIDPR